MYRQNKIKSVKNLNKICLYKGKNMIIGPQKNKLKLNFKRTLR